MKVNHPGKTPAQRRALDEIGCGNNCPRMAEATRKALIDRGLIVELGRKTLGHDRFGAITIPQYEMPVPVHYQWCKAMSEADDA